MKILHVITTLGKGGAESHLVALMQGQLAAGHRVEVAYLWGVPYWPPHLEALGIRVHALGLTRYGDAAPMLALRRIIRTWAPALVHAHMPPAELYTALALTGLGAVPMVTTKHNDEPFYRGPCERQLGNLVAKRSSHVIAISDAVRRFVTGQGLNIPADKVTTIRYGLDPAPYDAVSPAEVQAVRQGWGLGDDELAIGTVARFVPQKALHVLLAGFAAFRARSEVPARLVLVGAGPLEAALREQAEALGLTEAIVWAGFREDIPAVMQAFDVFALTSIYEGFGLVLLEAMAAGRPVVASGVSAIPEVVADGETGLLIPPNDPERLAAALTRLSSAAERRALGQAGRRRVDSHFRPADMVKRTLAVYDMVNLLLPLPAGEGPRQGG